MSDSNDELMMETMYWWGIPTLFRCEHNKDLTQCDIVLAGVPHSTENGTTERDQHLGPRAVRNVSAGLRRVHLDFNINPWKKKKIFDLGDVALPHANNNEKCIEDITSFYSKIARTNKPVVSIGGDHSITGGILQGLGSNNLEMTKGKKYLFYTLMRIQIPLVSLIILWELKKVLLTGELILLIKELSIHKIVCKLECVVTHVP